MIVVLPALNFSCSSGDRASTCFFNASTKAGVSAWPDGNCGCGCGCRCVVASTTGSHCTYGGGAGVRGGEDEDVVVSIGGRLAIEIDAGGEGSVGDRLD